MRLKVEKGTLALPEDFSFEIEQNSAFFSDDGAASIAATIPATEDNLQKLSNPVRIAQSNRFVNLFPAILSSGVFQKRGNLVVQSASKDAITCAIALEDSDFYLQHKDKNLKDIFSARKLTTYSTPADWSNWLIDVYQGNVSFPGLKLCPVAVNYDEDTDTYQVNNQPNTRGSSGTIYGLLHAKRITTEGGKSITVPEGYGLAPFLPLSHFFSILFELLGYSVGQNCFAAKATLSSLILLHNCSDAVCNGYIDYSDLVPGKTVAEILDWIKQKFHAQIAVHPETNTVDILLMEDILTSPFDYDLTGKAIGNPTFSYSSARRVTITPDVSLEGATPAAVTLSDIVNKYGGWVECDESQFSTATAGNCLLRLATGEFYEVSSSETKTRLGSNYFKYDRANAGQAEDFSPEDIMPPMVYVNGFLMPYIGERKHRQTVYNGSKKDSEQDIIIADYAGLSSNGLYNYATTQKYDDAGNLRSSRYNMNAEDMYFLFFKNYGNIILNNSIEISGEFNLPIQDIFGYNLYTLKRLNGQLVLPTYIRYEVGRRIRCLEAKFLLVKKYSDSDEDSPIDSPANRLVWQFNNSEMEAIKDGWPDPAGGLDTWYVWNEDDAYQTLEPVNSAQDPAYRGQQTAHITRLIDIWQEDLRAGGETAHVIATKVSFEQWWDAVAVAG